MDTPTPTTESSTFKDSLFRSLQLAGDIPIAPATSNAPIPDSGTTEKPTGPLEDFTEGRSTLGDMVSEFKKNEVVVPPVAAVPPVTPVIPSTIPPVTPPLEPVVATPAPAPAPMPKINVPVIPPPPVHDPIERPFNIDALDLNGLDDDEKNEVSTAAFAEKKYPGKYKGHTQKVLDFIRKHKQVYEEVRAESPDGEFDENNSKYRGFVKANRPSVTDAERRRLDRERMTEEAVVEAEQRLAKKYQRVEDEISQLKARPMVEKTMNDYKSLVKEVMPKAGDDSLVEDTVTEFSNLAVKAGEEFLMLSSQLRKYDSGNDTHKWLADFIQEQGDMFVKSGHTALKRGSKSFVPRSKFNALPAGERDKHFTFTDEDVLQLIAANAKAAAEFKVKSEKEKLEKAGYRRQPSTPVVTPTPVPVQLEPERSPRATVSSSNPVAPVTAGPIDPFLRYMQKG